MKPLNKLYSILIGCFCSAFSYSQCYDIYGLSAAGGEYGAGAIVKTDENGNSREVFSFIKIDTWAPYSQFCKAADGSLYAISPYGGKRDQGVLFQWDPETNRYTKKIDFTVDADSEADYGAWKPYGPLIQGTSGKFYGMTQYGGVDLFGGVIFEWDAITGNYTEKHRFDSESGREPLGALVQTGSGLMYGMTSLGGANDCGVLFKWDPESDSFLKLLDFDTTETGFDAHGSLCVANNGKLYGLTRSGGIHDQGVLFEYDPATDNYFKRHDFNDIETGSHPESSLVLAENGKLYGTTIEGGLNGYGVLFEWDPSNNEFGKLLDFDNAEKGRHPVGPLTLHENGILVGVTLSSVFEFDTETNTFTKKCGFKSLDLHPTSSLTKAENGKFYGFSGRGGLGAIMRPPFFNYGVIYEWDPVLDTCKIRLRFQDKVAGSGSNTMVSYDGKFYGTSTAGDDYCHFGLIFEFDPEKGKFQKKSGLYGGISPGPLLRASNGNFYGWTGEEYGECGADPTLFEWNPATEQYAKKYAQYYNGYYFPKGTIPPLNGHLIEANNRKIYFGSGRKAIIEWNLELDTLIIEYFNEDIIGSKPELLLLAKNGNLLGLTESGGTFNRGTLFEWDPETINLSKLLDFTDSTQMSSLIQIDDSLFYGVSNRGSLGIFYEWNQKSNTFNIKHKLKNIDHYGWTMGEDLTLADNGKLYGTVNTTDSGYYFFEWDPLNNSIKKLFNLDKSDLPYDRRSDIRYNDIVILRRYTRDTINITSCNEYVSPSGKYAWLESGVYLDTLQCATGCDSILTINLTIQSADTSVTRDQSVLAANADEATYQWINCGNDNVPVEGEIHQTFTPINDGNYAVIVSQFGCTDTSACISFIKTGLIISTFSHNIIIYPNPNDGSFFIDLGKVYPNIEISVTELEGRTIQRKQGHNARILDMKISALPGLYMVIITSENERAVYKILKK